jgi:hypothetical protein
MATATPYTFTANKLRGGLEIRTDHIYEQTGLLCIIIMLRRDVASVAILPPSVFGHKK